MPGQQIGWGISCPAAVPHRPAHGNPVGIVLVYGGWKQLHPMPGVVAILKDFVGDVHEGVALLKSSLGHLSQD